MSEIVDPSKSQSAGEEGAPVHPATSRWKPGRPDVDGRYLVEVKQGAIVTHIVADYNEALDERWDKIGGGFEVLRHARINPVGPVKISPYRRVVASFAAQMLEELETNRHKGSREDWRSATPGPMLDEVRYHLRKLEEAVCVGDPEEIKEYAADVGNIAMMVADLSGALD